MIATPEILLTLFLLGLTLSLFVFEVFRVDVVAILVLLAVALFPSLLRGINEILQIFSLPFSVFVQDLLPMNEVFSGFSKNAVISIIAVMIIGAGLEKTGVMTKFSKKILHWGGKSESKILTLVSSSVGFISSFMQNVGAAALFLPVLSKISQKTKIPLSRLLMPMGFCAILGGTITMVGSTPLILLNDLILASNSALPEGIPKMETLSIFAVAPIGIALLSSGIVYFLLFGKFVLPQTVSGNVEKNTTKYFQKHFGIRGEIFELRVEEESDLCGKTIGFFEEIPSKPFLLGMHDKKNFFRFTPDLKKKIENGTLLALMGTEEEVKKFAENHHLFLKKELHLFADAFDVSVSGIAEVVIPHTSDHVGKTLPEMMIATNAQFTFLKLLRNGEVFVGNLGKTALQAGDTIILHCTWKTLHAFHLNANFLVATEYTWKEELNDKMPKALLWFLLTLILILTGSITHIPLSLALLFGAMGMVLSGVLKIDEAYKAVDWKTIFLLASLIALGMAVEKTQTAAFIAYSLLQVVGNDVPVLVFQIVIALLGTFFTLVMSNAGATVLLVPLAVNLAIQVGGNPLVFALIVAISTSNSFLLPTHQVNALLMGPGGYMVKDYLKAGGIMTIIFLVVSLTIINLVF